MDTNTTTGLIIAAGAGTRLNSTAKTPKPLRKVSGLPLLKRIILTAHRGGLKRIVIVVGFQKERIMAYVKKNKWPVAIEFVDNPDWKRSNGLSVLAAKDVIKENFVLMMSDHIFDPQTLTNLVAHGLGPLKACLAVDYKTHQIFDKDDATKVLVKDNKIVAIEKALVTYNAIDTGLFLLSPSIFKALDDAKKDGDASLSDGIRTLSNNGEMGVFDIGGAFWQDVDTPESLKQAERVLINACRKPTDGIISRNFNRHISTAISRHLVKLPLSANQFTFFVLFMGLACGYLASVGTYTTYLVAGILFKLTSILDGVDGELSKLRLTSSKFGQWLDTICDNLTYIVFILGTIINLYTQKYVYSHILTGSAAFGLIMALGIIFWYVLHYSDSGSLLAIQKAFDTRKDLTLFSKIFFKAHFAIKRDFFSVVFLVFAILGKPQWVLFSTALAMNLTWITILQQEISSRKRKKLQQPTEA
ncbi:MAG: NTP transferase domain-containing protein [bacterium]|nr:NTP transferase domain-containing protein [bacterium]MBU1916744.1 NTP transferase domain-containing protein [bacterium]